MAKNSARYVPFARKYRPKNFKELLGQEVLTKTLSYCINNKKLTGAILLTGIRGVGKTSSARIVAKTVNCTSLLNDDSNNALPCELCKNCESFNKNNHPDIIEIDAASRTGVDDVREIIESSEYRPLLGEYKIFVIDEVHMLSKNAFNALLKLIEEPPPHVIFIFATTEVQKIPLTVLSRCQRYDLRRLSIEEILSLLRNITQNENLKFEEEALKIIALKSEGSARDATGLLDQASSYIHNVDQNDIITAESVNRMLGLVQVSTILKLVRLIIGGNAKEALKLLEEIYINSSNLEYFVEQTADFIAALTKEKLIPGFHEPLYKNYGKEMTDILVEISLSRLSILWQIFSSGTHQIKSSHNELITAEMLIIKAIYSCNIPDIEQLLDKSSQLEEFNLEQPDTNSNTPSELSRNIFDFLKFCHTQNEMELYYVLLNEVEIKNFNEPLIEIAANTKLTQEKNLKSLLHKWSGTEWNVIVSKQDKINSLKQEVLKKVKESKDFTVIKNSFPNADVSDIILKS
jgi:DNA polymerase-3 subunit gamma/tau